jgi:hypothetical protein
MVAKLVQPLSGLSPSECTYNLPTVNAIKCLSPRERYELDEVDALIQHQPSCQEAVYGYLDPMSIKFVLSLVPKGTLTFWIRTYVCRSRGCTLVERRAAPRLS